MALASYKPPTYMCKDAHPRHPQNQKLEPARPGPPCTRSE